MTREAELGAPCCRCARTATRSCRRRAAATSPRARCGSSSTSCWSGERALHYDARGGAGGAVLSLRAHRHAQLSPARRRYLAARALRELVDLMLER
ncbi:unnamed protein product [Euphydryas editha]|nr:unnamed protein product [Euphydryas editha]CAH2089211.1 unnamed protein product [Euphydryas editha]CAH2089212.1 unnamed protein product [Euphydryas editha]CAH2089213.1 unnamed protein product [Euphydryas editha]CAH2089214.1 unnamed protein product [Euphydryas editha]